MARDTATFGTDPGFSVELAPTTTDPAQQNFDRTARLDTQAAKDLRTAAKVASNALPIPSALVTEKTQAQIDALASAASANALADGRTKQLTYTNIT